MLHALARGAAAAARFSRSVRGHGRGIRYLKPVQQRLDNREISRDPWQTQHLIAVADVDPAQLIMVLQGVRITVEQFREPHAHRSALIERPAVGGPAFQFGAKPHANAKLFEQLSVQGVLGRLARLDLAAGELPHSGEVRGRRPPRHKQPVGFGQGVQYCAAYNTNESSHAPKSRGGASIGENGSGRLPEYPEYRARPLRYTNQPTNPI